MTLAAFDKCSCKHDTWLIARGNKAEVKRMSIYEYDEEATRQAIRVEEYERGKEEGRAEGRAEGMEALILDNLENGLAKEKIIAKLIKRFGVSESNAESCYENIVAKP